MAMGVFFGMSAISGDSDPEQAKFWASPWAIPVLGQRFRIKMGLALPVHAHLLYALPALLNPTWLVLLADPTRVALPIAFSTTYLGGVLAHLLVNEGGLFSRHRALAIEAAQRVVGLDGSALAERLLLRAAKSDNLDLQQASIPGLKRLGSQTAIDALTELQESRFEAVRFDAAKAMEGLQTDAGPIISPDLAGLPKLLESYQLLQRPKYDSETNLHRIDHQAISASFDAIEDLVGRQLPIKMAFPAVMCGKCKVRAVEQSQLYWRWIVCSACKEAQHLIPGIQTIVGIIGAFPSPEHLGEEYRLNIWDEEQKQPLKVAAETLEIQGGQPIDYDWAVSAVVEMLRQRSHVGGKGIRVKIVGQPGLSANTEALLRALDPGFRSGDGATADLRAQTSP